MPHVTIALYPGRSLEQKQQLAQAVARTVQQQLGCTLGAVSVRVEEVPSQEWRQKVYEPCIRSGSGELLVAPEYTPE